MTNGSGVSRGDRNRNARLSKLRETVPLSNAIVGIDLADKKQTAVAGRRRLEVCSLGARFGARPGTSAARWSGLPLVPPEPGMPE